MQKIIDSTAKIVNKNKSTNTFSRNTACFSRFVLSEGSFDTFYLEKNVCLEKSIMFGTKQ